MVTDNIISILKEAESIAILPHISLDGDGLGSSLAFACALGKLNKHGTVYLEEAIPHIYSFLPGSQQVRFYEGEPPKVDVAVALDSGDIERLGKRAAIFNNAGITVNIDHHQTNSMFAAHNYVQTGASAVGEIIYQFIKMMGLELDEKIATCLYVAIVADTGGFRFSNTTATTHQIAADLISNGVNVSEISRKVFDSVSREKVKLMGAAINSLELFEEGKVAFIAVTKEMIGSVGASDEDCDGIVNIGRSINGVEAAVMLKERDNGEIKVNLRSNSYVDVAAIAGMFSGGGHKRAAGCTIKREISEAKKMILNEIVKVL